MRAALYARVSSEEQVEGYSIDAQTRAFRLLCEGKQWTPYREYIEEGKSARTENISKRPVFKQAMSDGLDGLYDVLVVHKVDRFSRKLRITLEYFDKLAKAEVGFISIVEQMDFSTPWGKFTLSMLGGLAELYSDNLSQETKKGWHERREQGLYCGALPFGAVKNEAGVPIPDTKARTTEIDGQHPQVRNYDGLKLAFELGANGKSDRQVAVALNVAGYRTTGTHGSRPFSKDTVKDMLKNRFYIGYIPDGKGAWLKAIHQRFIDLKLFEETQKLRTQRTTNQGTVRSDATVYSLTGIARCAECGSSLRSFKGRGRVRLACNGRLRTGTCSQPSTFLDVYEEQLTAYFKRFKIPDNYQEQILDSQRKLESAYDVSKQRNALEARLERTKELYKWGHVQKEQYLKDFGGINRELQQLPPMETNADTLEKLATFVNNIALAWEQASQEQRNRLAGCLLEAVLIKDRTIVAVIPRPDFKPFFDLVYDSLSRGVLHWRPRGDSNP
jgi:site-specific DNA recombinase